MCVSMKDVKDLLQVPRTTRITQGYIQVGLVLFFIQFQFCKKQKKNTNYKTKLHTHTCYQQGSKYGYVLDFLRGSAANRIAVNQ